MLDSGEKENIHLLDDGPSTVSPEQYRYRFNV